MDLQHTEDRRMLADSLDRFVREQYSFEARQRIAGSAEGMSRTIWQQLAELGALAALFTEDQGGMGGSGFDIAVVFESLGRGLVVEPLAGAMMAGQVLAAARGDAHRATLDALIGGETLVLLAHEEADTGASPARVALQAERSGDGWRLSGLKAPVPQGEQADAFVVSARVAGRPGDADGVALFWVPATTAGLSRRGTPLIDGGRAAELRFDGVTLPGSAALAIPGQDLALLEATLARGLLALAAESLGAMEAAKAATLEYLRTRKQFGVPIGSFQALQHRMADLLLEVEQARSAVINASAALSAPRAQRERAMSAAKLTVGRVGTRVAEESIQLHGGIGMTWELPLAHVAKRLVMVDHQFGDEDQHLGRYIALGRSPEVGAP
jgi:alkylation response protein AidB-like acyl-CoA dehydrogenase